MTSFASAAFNDRELSVVTSIENFLNPPIQRAPTSTWWMGWLVLLWRLPVTRNQEETQLERWFDDCSLCCWWLCCYRSRIDQSPIEPPRLEPTFMNYTLWKDWCTAIESSDPYRCVNQSTYRLVTPPPETHLPDPYDRDLHLHLHLHHNNHESNHQSYIDLIRVGPGKLT